MSTENSNTTRGVHITPHTTPLDYNDYHRTSTMLLDIHATTHLDLTFSVAFYIIKGQFFFFFFSFLAITVK